MARSWSVLATLTALILAAMVHTADAAEAGPSGWFTGEVTVTATGEAEETEDVPASVTVIDQQEIEDAQAADTSELLRRVPGLTVLRSGSEGGQTSVFTRGTESDHTLVLFDGVRLNSPYFAGFDWSTAPTAGLAAVDIVRGPYSALYGADAVGGVVNLIPARAGDGFAASLLGEAGGDEWRRLEAVASYGGEHGDLYLSGFHRRGTGELENSDFEADQWLLDGGLSFGDGRRVAVLVRDVSTELEIPFSGATLTPNRRQSYEGTLVAVPLSWRVDEEWDLALTASRVEGDLAFRDPDDPWGYTAGDTHTEIDEGRLSSRHRLGDHTLTWGGAWREGRVDDSSVFGVNLDDESVETTSLFLQDGWRPVEDLVVLAGVRWDDADQWGSEVSPRINVGWRLADEWRLIGAYGEAFRQPAVGELYYPMSGNPDLEAETAQSWEAGVERRFAGAGLVFRLTAFGTDLENMIDFDYVAYAYANVASADISGAELVVSKRLGSALHAGFSLTNLDTEGADGEPLLRRPDWSGVLTLTGRFVAGIRGDVAVIWLGARDDIDPVTFGRTEVGGVVTARASVAIDVADLGQVTVRVTNLSDRDYDEVLGYPTPGRRLYVGFRMQL